MNSLPTHTPARRLALGSGVIAAHAALLLLGAMHPQRSAPPEDAIEVVLLAPQALPATPAAPVSRPAPVVAPPVSPRPSRSPAPPRSAAQPPASAPSIETTASTQSALPGATESTGTASDGRNAASSAGTGASAPSGHGEARETVSAARFDADYLKNPPPAYPPQSRRLGEEGKVILRVQVSTEGQALNVEIKTSSGSVRLDEAAQRTVRGWRFVPARRGETPVDSWVLVPIVFKLEQ